MIARSTISKLCILCIGDSLSRTAVNVLGIAERPAEHALLEYSKIAVEKTKMVVSKITRRRTFARIA